MPLLSKITCSLVFANMLFACNHQPAKPQAAHSSPESAAEEKLKDAAALYPDSLVLTENLIQYYRENGRYDQALQHVNASLLVDSLSTRLWDIKAILHFENDDTLAAIKAFEKALLLHPSVADQISLGTLYAQKGHAKALQLADDLLNNREADAQKEAFFIKGLYHSFSGNKKEAIVFFDRCIELNFTFMDAYREKAIAQYELTQYEAALATLNKAITLQNSFDEGYYYAARCYEKLNRKQEAIEAYQSALMYDPNYTEARDALAKLGVKN